MKLPTNFGDSSFSTVSVPTVETSSASDDAKPEGAYEESAILPPREHIDIKDVCKLIEDSEFVAIDLEFSGLFSDYKKFPDIQGHYQFCVENVGAFLTIQLGICVVSRCQSNSNHWEFSPFNFYVFPSQRQVFQSDTSSVRWLQSQGFDFGKWISEGKDYVRLMLLADVQGTTSDVPQYLKDAGLQRIIETVSRWAKPLIVHNGLLDMLHIFDKFIGPLPNTIETFCMNWQKIFSGGFYDTKRLAQEGKHTVFNFSDPRSLNLEELRGALLSNPKRQSTFAISPFGGTDNPEYTLNYGPYILHKKTHEAGFDSMLTAQTFILELEAFWRAASLEQNDAIDESPNKRIRVGDNSPTRNSSVIPDNWEELEVLNNMKNVVELSNVHPGHLRLSTYAPMNGAAIPDPLCQYQSPFRIKQQAQPHRGPQPKLPHTNNTNRSRLHPKLQELFERHDSFIRTNQTTPARNKCPGSAEKAPTTKKPTPVGAAGKGKAFPYDPHQEGVNNTCRRRRRKKSTALLISTAIRDAEARFIKVSEI